MLRLIALREVRAHKNVAHLQRRYNVIYPDRNLVVERLLHLENNQIMPNNIVLNTKTRFGNILVVCVIKPSL